ncbi:conjugal transfer protein TraM, partial [Salmonella enterica]|nr:conjugal transfer protein TraM [Salmonella enterica]
WKAANPPQSVIASDNGRIIPLPTINDPVYSDADIIDYGARHIREDFTLDFVHYREQINARRDSFSTEGFTSYYNALVNSNILANIRDKKMNLSVLTSTGVINSKGVLDNGAYAWRLQYPITLRLNGQTSSLPPQNFTLVQIVTRADPRLKKDGLEVIQVVTREAAAQ